MTLCVRLASAFGMHVGIRLIAPLVAILFACAPTRAPIATPEPVTVTDAAPPAPDAALLSTETLRLASQYHLDASVDPGPAGERASARSEGILRVLRSHKAAFRACYDEAYSRLTWKNVRKAVVFRLDPKGKVTSAELDKLRSDDADETLSKCLLDHLKTLAFPEHPQGKESTVHYEWLFHPQKGNSGDGGT